MAAFAYAAVPGPDAVRIRVLAERLPERPGTPGVSPADRVHWNRLAAYGHAYQLEPGLSSRVTTGGDWSWKVDELDNSKPVKPHRVAVAFNKPVLEAEVAFRFEAQP